MKVPLLDLHAQYASIGPEVDQQIRGVIESCQFVNGPKVAELEAQISEYTGAAHGIGVSSGTDALLVALMGIGVEAGDVVLTTPYSFFATAGAIVRLGATPAFVDIDERTYNLSASQLRAWFEQNGAIAEKVKAIVPVHLYGQCADMGGIMAIASEHGLPVIEDAAQAIGSQALTSQGVQRAGSIGDVGCFSFFPSKNLGCMGDGGMVVVQDETLAARIRKLRNHGAHPKYYHELVGGNFRLDALQAAVLCAKLPHLEGWHRARRKHAQIYDQALEGVGDLVIPLVSHDRNHHIYNQYVVSTGRRDELRAHLAEAGIGSEIYYPVPFHMQKCFADLGYRPGAFPVSEKAAASTVALPVYPELEPDMQDYVISAIREFYA